MGIGDWGLGIGDWVLGVGPDAQSPIRDTSSPIPNFKKKFFSKISNIFNLNILFIIQIIIYQNLNIQNEFPT